MKNIVLRGKDRYKAHVSCNKVRVYKTFYTEADAAKWVADRIEERRTKRSFDPSIMPRPRTDYTALSFPREPVPGLLSHDEIVQAARPRERVCGIYFLIVDGQVMYVGQSIDVHHRVGAHAMQRRQFDAVHVITCPRHQLTHLESRYILALQPPWNRGRNGALILSVHRGTPNLRA